MILLKDIAPAAENNIETKFILLDKGRVIVEGQHKTCLAFVADETASVHFQLWGDECDAFEADDIIDLSNGIFSKQRNNLVLRAGKRGKIMKIGEFTMSFVETPNMSEIHWVPDPTNSKKYIQGHVISTHSPTSPSLEVLSLKPSCDAMLDQRKSDRTSYEPKETMPKENGGNGCVKMQHSQKADSGSSSSVHPVRSIEDENLDYDSNASSSSFEFDKGERHVSKPATRFLFRPMPSKWNNAQKWIMSRQSIQAYSKKNVVHNQANRLPMSMARVAPESGNYDFKLLTGSKVTETKLVDLCRPTSHMGLEKFFFIPSEAHSVSGQSYGRNPVMGSFPQSKDLKDVSELD
ncbi:unnamed protein product [Lupinus luteus]|uniref:Uncharacterized protein n=1 Tax=Lupinus luteus TaxID=3873 RepID=A0AAV1XSN7_LUPLU